MIVQNYSQSQEAQSQRFCSCGREAGKVSELVHISQIGREILHYSFFFFPWLLQLLQTRDQPLP